MGYRNSVAVHCEYGRNSVTRIQDAGFLPAKLCVVTGYNVAKGSAFVAFRGFGGYALLTQREIIRAGWTEVSFGNFLVCDIEQHEGKARATNARAATEEDFSE